MQSDTTTQHIDPWDEAWRTELAGGVIKPGVVVHTGDGWTTYLRDRDMTMLLTGLPAIGPFIVIARVPDPEIDESGTRVGWDDVLLYDTKQHVLG